MKFSTSFLDSLFGEKVEIEIPSNEDVIRRTVTKKWLKQMQVKGKISSLITTNILDPINGNYSEGWSIGEDISQESYDKFKDLKGEIYIVNVYKEGNIEKLILKKELWEETKRKMESFK